MKREEDEVDLSLSLSIGSNVSSTRPASPPSDTTYIRSDESNGLDSLNPQRKRRLFALRRQEAKKKRIEKKQRQQLNNSNGIPVNNRTCHGNMSAGDRVAKKGRFGNFDQIQYPSLSVVPVPVPVPMTIPMPMPCLYLMPCWAPDVAATASPSISAVGPDGLNSGFLQFERSDSEKNVSSSSSAVSDAESASLQGSSGSDSRSHSEEKPTTSNIMNSTTAKIISTPSSLNKHSHYSPTHRVGDEEKRKLPTPSLPQMPYVWTTGDGPDGKTITGFLYRCTKTEISIVCVCHGSLFSPAEFVRHAGGTDISHPMRHIVVVPSPAFG